MLAHAAPGNVVPTPPNKALKLSRPGFGPAAEPPGPNSTCAASRRLQIDTHKCGSRRAAIRAAAWASAAQLSANAVSRTAP